MSHHRVERTNAALELGRLGAIDVGEPGQHAEA